MKQKYLVILFKNKFKKRIIKKFVSFDRAKDFFNKKKLESSNIIFPKLFENGNECDFELGLIEKGSSSFEPVYFTDEFGRNLKAKVIDDDMYLINVFTYKTEEKIFDLQKNRKITTPEIMSKYLVGQGVKMISSINNKVVIQNDDEINLFSLKNENECKRFLDSISTHFFKIKKGDCIIVKDVSSAQKKYLFSLLSEKGVDKKTLYRKYTTYPRSK